jgi:8-oxo-dGTP diphosphatase
MEKIARVGVGIMILKNGKVLLGKRHFNAEKADSALRGEGTWTCPGGKLEFGEKLEDCIKREAIEETELKLNRMKLISVSNDIAYGNHFVTIGFLSEDFDGEPKVMEPDEITEWKWFPLNNLPEPMFFPSLKLIKNYIDKEVYKGD